MGNFGGGPGGATEILGEDSRLSLSRSPCVFSRGRIMGQLVWSYLYSYNSVDHYQNAMSSSAVISP